MQGRGRNVGERMRVAVGVVPGAKCYKNTQREGRGVRYVVRCGLGDKGSESGVS
jgi:hypothetical protein